MKEKSYLLDSNIIVYHLNNDDVVKDFLFENINYCSISVITYIEVLSFHFQSIEHENLAKDLLNSFNIIYLDKNIASQSIENRKIKRIKIPDNIIASTAQVNNLILVTRNEKDFKSLNVSVLNPFDNKT
jgi:predicted nucleic acid-binding protein